jgi:hypothetical protein
MEKLQCSEVWMQSADGEEARLPMRRPKQETGKTTMFSMPSCPANTRTALINTLSRRWFHLNVTKQIKFTMELFTPDYSLPFVDDETGFIITFEPSRETTPELTGASDEKQSNRP